MMRFALVRATDRISAEDVAAIAAALELQLQRDVAPAWACDRPEVVVVDAEQASAGRAAGDLVPIVLLDRPDGRAGILGDHDDDDGHPAARVFASPILDAGGAVLGGGRIGVSVASVVSHEAIEAFVDPQANGWAVGAFALNGRSYAAVAIEPCDPVQALLVAVATPSGRIVQLSNFVLPAWFDAGDRSGGPYDFAHVLARPLSIADGGYVLARAGGPGSETEEFAAIAPSRWRMALMRARHSRASRRRLNSGWRSS